MNFNSKIFLTFFFVFQLWQLSSKSIELYGFYPVWHNKTSQSWEVDNLYKSYKDSLVLGYAKAKKKPSVNTDIFKLIEKIETPVKNIEEATCIIGFYFTDETGRTILDIFTFERKFMSINSCQKIEFNNKDHNARYGEIVKILQDKKYTHYSEERRKSLLFQYLLPYQAEYYSKKVYSVGLDSVKLSQIDFERKMKINGRIRVKDVFNEVEKSFSLKATAFHKAGGYGIIDIVEGKHPNKKQLHKYNESYRQYFNKNPVLYKYIKAAEAYKLYQTTTPNSLRKAEHRKSFESQLYEFLDIVDQGKFNSQEAALFLKNGRDMHELRNEFVIRADQILKCDQNKELAKQAILDGVIDQAIYHYYNMVKFCGGADNYSEITKLFSQRETLYQNLTSKAKEHEGNGNFQEALDLLLQAEKMLPYMPSIPFKIRQVENMIIEQNKNLKPSEQYEKNIELKIQILENKLSDLVYNSYKYKVVDRTISIERNGQIITVKFIPESSGLNMAAEVSYYPVGEFTYSMEGIENNFISSSINSITDFFSYTNDQGIIVRPRTDLFCTGSADLTQFKGTVASNSQYANLNITVIPCNKEIIPKSLKDLRKSTATNEEKNLALAFLRAYHKRQQIFSKCKDRIDNSSICAKVIIGDTRYRSVLVTVQVTINK